jgi:hypothetical protein
MATTSCISGAGLRKPAELLREIQVRLQLSEVESGQMLRRFRALPADDSRRFALLRQLEIAAAVSAELQDLENLITGTDTADHTADCVTA